MVLEVVEPPPPPLAIGTTDSWTWRLSRLQRGPRQLAAASPSSHASSTIDEQDVTMVPGWG